MQEFKFFLYKIGLICSKLLVTLQGNVTEIVKGLL